MFAGWPPPKGIHPPFFLCLFPSCPRVTTGHSSEEELGATKVVAGGTLPAVSGTQTGRDSSWTLQNTCAEPQTVHQDSFFIMSYFSKPQKKSSGSE